MTDIGTRARPNANRVLNLMRDDDLDDPWGTAMSWAIAVAENLYAIGVDIIRLDYQPSAGGAILESHADFEVQRYLDCTVHSGVWDLDTVARIEEVQRAGRILDRYLDWCKAAGRDY